MKHIFIYLSMALIVLMTFSCNHLEPATPEIDNLSTAKILAAIQDIYLVDYTEDGGQYHTIYFKDPTPVVIGNNKETTYPYIQIAMDKVTSYEDDGEHITIVIGQDKYILTYYFDNTPLTFEDGTTTKSFAFAEYARLFEEPLNGYYHIEISTSYSWIKTRLSENKKSVVIYLSENTDADGREGTVLVTNTRTNEEIKVIVNQAGCDEIGALKPSLLEFYKAMDGDNWRKLNGDPDNRDLHWTADKSMLEWYGLTPSASAEAKEFGEEGKVYYGATDNWELLLVGNNLKGIIPDSFWDACKHFSSITISRTDLIGNRISDKLWHARLKKVDFHSTNIGGDLTPSLLNAKDIEELKFSSCLISGELPQGITSLTKLRVIDFSRDMLLFTSLKDIDFINNRLKGTFPQDIEKLTELTYFSLSNNIDITGILPDGFYSLNKLQVFAISCTQIGGRLSPRITELEALREFYIENCEFEGTIPEEFGRFRFAASFEGNYFEKMPEFIRYRGYDGGPYDMWILLGGIFPQTYHCVYQRDKKTGRPNDYCEWRTDEETGITWLQRTYEYTNLFGYPKWAQIRYGRYEWGCLPLDNEEVFPSKFPSYPYADDLQYPANEYYFDGKDWRHPNYEYPAREYCKNDKGEWIHDASCPWDKEVSPEVSYADRGKWTPGRQ